MARFTIHHYTESIYITVPLHRQVYSEQQLEGLEYGRSRPQDFDYDTMLRAQLHHKVRVW